MKLLLVFLFFFLMYAAVSMDPVALKDSSDDYITVTVEGAVDDEKTLQLNRYATLQDALDEVELQSDADLNTLNPQMVLKDKDCIVIPEKSEVRRVSINTETAEELVQLPGIGPSTAEKIILYREENGLYQSLEDLMRVKGIGPAKFEKIKDLITL
ncbi:MAG: helix-hairpin-helix domain-containing protein [Solobacterium sp.]|nr:helix-hairpin-helix domain-containing protein [Solobacterium sp.]